LRSLIFGFSSIHWVRYIKCCFVCVSVLASVQQWT
jgi:hypothetical protein